MKRISNVINCIHIVQSPLNSEPAAQGVGIFDLPG